MPNDGFLEKAQWKANIELQKYRMNCYLLVKRSEMFDDQIITYIT